MKVFIAGATGVLGKRVVKGLVKKGHQVLGLARSQLNVDWLSNNQAVPIEGNLFDQKVMIQCVSGCDAVLHLATSIPKRIRTDGESWELNDRIRREGTKNLVEAAIKNQCKLYLQQSITFLYGNHDDHWIDEEEEILPPEVSYLRSAFDMEEMILEAMNDNKLPAIILRFGNFYSRDAYHTQKMFKMIQAGHLSKISGGKSIWSIIHIDDAAKAVIKSVENYKRNLGQIFNICDDEPTSFSDLVDFMADHLGTKKPRSVPGILAKPFIGKENVEFFELSIQCKNNKAKEGLNWSPQYPTYREGYSQEIKQWLKETAG